MLARLAALAIATAALLGAVCSTALGADRIFWANFNQPKVSFANLDGSGGGDLNTTGATAPNQAVGVAIDSAAGRIYWVNQGSGKVSYANLDGSGGGGDLNTSGVTVSTPRGLAIDPAGGRLYWGNGTGIAYANLNGTGGGSLSTTGATVNFAAGVAIDPAANRIYWANFNLASPPNKISYANLDGSGGGADLTTTGATVNQPRGVAIDKATGRVYWNNVNTGSPGRVAFANLDGTGGGGDLNTVGATTSSPFGIALDPNANRIYIASADLHKIGFTNLDGTGSSGDLATTGATIDGPGFPAILRAPVASGAPTVAGGSQTGSLLTCSSSWLPDLLGAHLYRAPQSVSYQWTLNGTGIGGATSSTHTASSPGSYACRVSATNAAGTGGPVTSAAHPVSDPTPITPITPLTPTTPSTATPPANRKCKRPKKRRAVVAKKCRRKK